MKTIRLKNIQIKEIIITPDQQMVITYAFLDQENQPVYMKQVVLKNADFPQIDKLEKLTEQLLTNLKLNEGI